MRFSLQAAMEYLMTYGWAVLVIALVALALFYLHVFNPPTSSTCVLPAGLGCTNLYMVQNGLLTVTLFQLTGSSLNVTGIECNTNTTVSNALMVAPYNPPSNQVTVAIGSNFTLALQCYSLGQPFSGPVGGTYSGFLLINYTQQYLPHTAYGDVYVRIS